MRDKYIYPLIAVLLIRLCNLIENQTMPTLLIIGGNGVLGAAAAKHFLQKGFRVTLVVRNKEKARELEKQGASLVYGDLSDLSSLAGIFSGVDIVLTAAHSLLGKGRNSSEKVDFEAHAYIVDEANKAAVSQFIYTSINTARADHPIDFFRHKYNIEQHLAKSGMNYTILKLPAFMEWHAYRLLGKTIVEKGKVMILGAGENPTNFIAVKDIVAALDVIAGNKEYFNRSILLGGPENLSRNQVAQLFGKAMGVTPKIKHMPTGVVKVMGAMLRPFHPGFSRVMKFAVHGEHSDEKMDPANSITQFGLQPTSMESFIASVISQNQFVKQNQDKTSD